MNIINLIIGILILFFIILIGFYVVEKGDSFVKVNEGFNMPGHDGSGTIQKQHTWNTSGSGEASTSSTESDSELPSYYLKVKMNDITWYLQEPTAPPQNEGGSLYYVNTMTVVEDKSLATKFNIHNRGTSNMYITIVDPKNKALPAPYDESGGSPGSLLQFPTNPNNYLYGSIVIISINDLSTSAGVHPPSLSNGSLSPIYLLNNSIPQAFTLDIVPVASSSSGSGGFSPAPATPSPSPAPAGSGGSIIDPVINPVISPAPSGSGGFSPIPKEPIPYCKSPTLPNVNNIHVHYSNTNANI